MRQHGILIDENIPFSKQIAKNLRKKGYNVLSVGEYTAPGKGTSDRGIVKWAKRNKFLIISNDKGFELEPSKKSDRILIANTVVQKAKYGKGSVKTRRVNGITNAIEMRVLGIKRITKNMKR